MQKPRLVQPKNAAQALCILTTSYTYLAASVVYLGWDCKLINTKRKSILGNFAVGGCGEPPPIPLKPTSLTRPYQSNLCYAL